MSHTTMVEDELLKVDALVAILSRLKHRVTADDPPVLAICSYVYTYASEEAYEYFLDFKESCWPDWLHFSGCTVYPVFDGYSTVEGSGMQYHSLNHWEGRQRELRLSLIDFTIGKLNERAAQIEV